MLRPEEEVIVGPADELLFELHAGRLQQLPGPRPEAPTAVVVDQLDGDTFNSLCRIRCSGSRWPPRAALLGIVRLARDEPDQALYLRYARVRGEWIASEALRIALGGERATVTTADRTRLVVLDPNGASQINRLKIDARWALPKTEKGSARRCATHRQRRPSSSLRASGRGTSI